MNFIEQNVGLKNSTVGEFSWVRLGSEIINSNIGDDVFIGFQCHLYNVVTESNVQFASKAVVGTPAGETVTIQKGAWLGAGASVKAGVTIGEGAVIGAHAKVNRDVPAYTVVIGSTEQVMKKRDCIHDRFYEYRDFLLEIMHAVENDMWIKENESKNFITADIISDSEYTIGAENILIGKVHPSGGIYLGEGVKIGNNNIFEAFGSIRVGNNVRIGNNTHLISNGHDYKLRSLPRTLLPITLEDHVVVGDNVTMIGEFTIPQHTQIPADSLIIGKENGYKLLQK